MNTFQRRILPLVLLCLMLPLSACNFIDLAFNSLDVSKLDDLGMSEEDQFCLWVMTGGGGFTLMEANALCGLADRQCLYMEVPVGSTWQEALALCPKEGTALNSGGGSPVSSVAPQQPASTIDCSAFRLTSPLDGLPNGVATFYWDPMPGATSYVVNVAGEGAGASFGAGAGSTSVSGDVSQSAIGGMYAFTISAHALIDGEVVCSRSVNVNRAAPDLDGNNDSGGGSDDGDGGADMGPCGIRGCIDLPDDPAEDPDDEIR